MSSLELITRSGVTKILFGDSLNRVKDLVDEERMILITDSNVGKLYSNKLKGFRRIEVGIGEKSKTLNTIKRIYTKLLQYGVDRTFFVLGVGGGVVTDVTGFSASTFMRGVKFGFVPTTLLAQVDASIGGKNGVNLQGFKNMIGTIRQPEFCLIDFDFLKTLPRKQLISGMAEIIKCGAISDKSLFEFVEKNGKGIISLEGTKLKRAVSSAIAVKIKIVEMDEMENWERMKLNFGHTVGHAVEKVAGLPHGYAVSIGMVAAARLSVLKGLLPSEEADRIETQLGDIGLPTRTTANTSDLIRAIYSDKKSAGDSINMVLLTEIGSATILKIRKDELRGTLQEVCM